VPRQIVINASPQEVRVAIVDDAHLTEILIERRHEQGLAGSVYKGRVTRVLPGIQAAFVDIGLPKAAFLHASDVDTRADDETGANDGGGTASTSDCGRYCGLVSLMGM
jgi:ribonuclease G